MARKELICKVNPVSTKLNGERDMTTEVPVYAVFLENDEEINHKTGEITKMKVKKPR